MSVASPWARLGLFAAVLVVVFAASFGVGSAGDPIARTPSTEVDHDPHG